MQRQPIEEGVRLAISDLVASVGDVEIERHSYEWRPGDLLVWVHLRQPIEGGALTLFLRQVVEKMRTLLPSGQPLDDWLVVITYGGKTLCRIARDDNVEEIDWR
jgi:hypothetical protein